jgi:hypothetical protein
MHIRIVVDRLGVATLFPAARAGLDFELKRGKIALNNHVKACRLAVGTVDCLTRRRLLCEAINDAIGEPASFYGVVKRDFPALQFEIAAGPRGRKQRRNAEAVHNNPEMHGRVKRAWAVRTPANESCGSMPDGRFGCGRKGKFPANKRGAFAA